MKLRPLCVLLAVCALALLPAGTASAHPLGNFTVNRYDGLVAAPGQLRVDHVEDLAEIPATQAKPEIERLGLAAWARQRCAGAAAGSRLSVDGRAAALTAARSSARPRPGQAGLDTLRVECRLTAPLPRGATVSLGFHSAGADGGPGWREITARGDRMTLSATDVPKTSVSRELTVYPQDLLSSPADTATASLRVRPGGPALAADAQRQAATGSGVLPRGADRWTRALDDLVARQDLTVGFAALALLIAVVLGAMHALAPGHGKTLMAATAAARGGRARPRDVLPLAASVTVTHTLGVVALGLLVTAGSAATPTVISWLGIAGGALVLAAGVTLVRRAWHNRAHAVAVPREAAVRRELATVGAGHGAADHPHEHSGVEHTHGGHTHGGHTHGHPHGHEEHSHGEHAHGAHHHGDEAHGGHSHGEHTHAGHTHTHSHTHGGHTHSHGGHTHTHGGHTHTHPTAPTLRGTILLGFAGGLVPSPSAVVVLVGAAALGKAWFGLLLVVAYGAGLALTLTAAGFAVVRLGAGAARVLERRPRWATHPLTALAHRTLPLVSALVVLALGTGLVLKGAASALG
ncbi:nickel transporter [Streptomyces echinatus]|uniref:ABC-type nickel/cobalt efflux system permease component RcnA n=1 Tax=Streptomyces echinatus TaxID=67293 RepID=A0A7W9UT98_9ACTN|nr:nickel transporter [Streptomyces echinatus]MBB5930420.1 ABC-type nickel/cobalt efflux system permease component RcnA [Streptomyces echinatus]